MKRLAMAVVCTIAALWLAVGVNVAAGNPLPERTCATIQWNPEFLKSYPTAAAACRGIIDKGGIKFAEFRGTVSQVNHDVVQVQVLDVMGTPISTIAFLMGRDGQVVVDQWGGKIEDLKRGDQLTFWIREGLFGVSPTLIDHPMLLVRPENVEQLIENLGLPQHFIDLR
jgi:hypothetical protein